jgi:hypothetical protein
VTIAPVLELTRPQPVAREAAFVQPVQLCDRKRDQRLHVVRGHEARRERIEASSIGSSSLAHSVAHIRVYAPYQYRVIQLRYATHGAWRLLCATERYGR